MWPVAGHNGSLASPSVAAGDSAENTREGKAADPVAEDERDDLARRLSQTSNLNFVEMKINLSLLGFDERYALYDNLQ